MYISILDADTGTLYVRVLDANSNDTVDDICSELGISLSNVEWMLHNDIDIRIN